MKIEELKSELINKINNNEVEFDIEYIESSKEETCIASVRFFKGVHVNLFAYHNTEGFHIYEINIYESFKEIKENEIEDTIKSFEFINFFNEQIAPLALGKLEEKVGKKADINYFLEKLRGQVKYGHDIIISKKNKKMENETRSEQQNRLKKERYKELNEAGYKMMNIHISSDNQNYINEYKKANNKRSVMETVNEIIDGSRAYFTLLDRIKNDDFEIEQTFSEAWDCNYYSSKLAVNSNTDITIIGIIIRGEFKITTLDITDTEKLLEDYNCFKLAESLYYNYIVKLASKLDKKSYLNFDLGYFLEKVRADVVYEYDKYEDPKILYHYNDKKETDKIEA